MKSIELAKEAIRRYFGDTGRSPEETCEGLDELIDEIEDLKRVLGD